MNAMRVVGKSKDLEGSEETPAQTPQEAEKTCSVFPIQSKHDQLASLLII